MKVFVGRQPIFNEFEQIIGYELLYRNEATNRFPYIDSDVATIDVLINTFLSIGIEEVAKGKLVFVNFGEKLLMSTIFDYIDCNKVIVEILEDVELTPAVIQRVKELKDRGFKFALDDFIITGQHEGFEEIFKYIDYVKIDFLATPVKERMEMENKLKASYPHLKFLAEKVESRKQYEVAKHTGYRYFQGYFFEQPQVLSSTEVPPNVIQYLQLLSLLREDEPDINLLTENIERDISLTYKLLQLINHSKKRTKSKVRSIKQAVLLLGLAELRKWMYLLAMREANVDLQNDSKKEIMFSSLFRAKVCEKLAGYHRLDNHAEYFLVGLFSLIDAILNRSLNSILQTLPFSEEVAETISGSDTAMKPYLDLSIALNKADWETAERLADELEIPYEVVMLYFTEANEWVKETFDFIN